MSLKDLWFKFVIDRWFGGTRLLSFAAKGLYIDLIALFRDGKTVPNDARAIAGLLQCRDHRSVNKPLAELLARGKIKVDAAGNLYNERAEADKAERSETRPKKKKGEDDSGGSDSGGQTALPFRPHVVHRSVENDGESGGPRREIADHSAISPPSVRGQIAKRPRIFWAKCLKSLSRDSTSESQSHIENQSLVAAAMLYAARARDGPTARA